MQPNPQSTHFWQGRRNLRLLLPRDFRLYLASRFCTATGMTMLRAAILWHVFALSHSAFHLGLIGLAQFAPALSLSLVAGAVADTYDRRRVMMAAETLALVCALVLFLETRSGGITLLLLYAMVFPVAIAGAFDNPARAALLPTLVAREVFPRAVAIASTNQALALVTGPALCGFIIVEAGIASVYAAYVLLIGASVATLALMRRRAVQTPGRAVTLQMMREGLAYVRRHQVILGCMTLDMFAVIFGGATALLPIYANDILHVGASGYGLLTSSIEIGALATSLVLIALPPVARAGRALLLSIAVYGVATVVFGLSRSFPLSVIAYLIVGVGDQVSVVMRATAIQLSTPDELRGRVSSVNMIFIGASNQLGAAESGFVAALTNATFSVVSGGIGCLLVLVAVVLILPELRRYRISGGTPPVS
ncbi:MAG: MFS transporter [Candidatus Binatia bacterium]|jgi:MFS family permease